MGTIDNWWPLLHEEIRRVLVNDLWSPVAPFSRNEIARLGGPAADDVGFWEHRDGEVYMPHEMVTWIVHCSDFKRLNAPTLPDPRAAYFRRGWPRRQP